MITRSEQALQALVTALEAKAAGDDPALPVILRNEDVFARMEAVPATGVHRFLNVWDGEVSVADEALGADLVDAIDDEEPGAGAYEIELRPRIDWICVGPQADRDAAFDAGLIAIHDAIRGAIVDGDRVYLAGAVDHAAIERVVRSGLATDGLAGVKACEITPLLQFTSARPF
jgi:hypothetical protein